MFSITLQYIDNYQNCLAITIVSHVNDIVVNQFPIIVIPDFLPSYREITVYIQYKVSMQIIDALVTEIHNQTLSNFGEGSSTILGCTLVDSVLTSLGL